METMLGMDTHTYVLLTTARVVAMLLGFEALLSRVLDQGGPSFALIEYRGTQSSMYVHRLFLVGT